jgi:hypothetical protein
MFTSAAGQQPVVTGAEEHRLDTAQEADIMATAESPDLPVEHQDHRTSGLEDAGAQNAAKENPTESRHVRIAHVYHPCSLLPA